MEKITMSTKEINQIKVLERLKDRLISQKTAAQALNLSERQIRNKIKRFIKEGPKGLIHRNRGKPSKRQWNPEEQTKALEVVRDSTWRDFGPTFASEKLNELHDIKISAETLRKVMIKEGLWRTARRKPIYRQRRERKPSLGMLVQLDGSDHDWFEGRGPKCTLLVFIDDATSKILWLEFVNDETVKELMEATRSYFLKYGKPRSFYVDNASVFKVTSNNVNNKYLSQFARAMKELDVEMIYARSPQAKGRVERFNKTAQDRLIKEMRLANISTMKAANAFVQNIYIPQHNEKFAIEPALVNDEHRPVSELDLYNILCTRYVRILQNDYTVSFKNKILQIEEGQIALTRPKDAIAISKRLDDSLYLTCRNKLLQFKEIQKKATQIIEKKIMDHVQKPPQNHPWRSYTNRQFQSRHKRPQMEVISGY